MSEPQGDAVVVDSPDQSAHRAIARRFIGESAAHATGSLTPIVEADDDGWWRRWNRTLDALGLLERWRRYRASAFEQLLSTALGDHGLDDRAIRTVVESMREQRSRTRTLTSETRMTARSAGSDRVQLQQLLIKVIGQMGVNEVRSICVPIGLVIDALAVD